MRILSPELRLSHSGGASGDESATLNIGVTDPLAIMINAIQVSLVPELSPADDDNILKRFQLDMDEDNTALQGLAQTIARTSILWNGAVRSFMNFGATTGFQMSLVSGPPWISWHSLEKESRPLTFRDLRWHSREETGSTTSPIAWHVLVHYQVVELDNTERVKILSRIL